MATVVSTPAVSGSGDNSGLVQLGRKTVSTPAASVSTPAGDGLRVYIETYGCQMNVADTDLIRGLLSRSGYARTESADDADVILINTCAVRERAEERVYRRAEQLKVHKRRRPGTVLAVVGCMAEHLKTTLAERAPHVDVIAGPDSYRRIETLVSEARGSERNAEGDMQALIDVRLDREETYEGAAPAEGDGVAGFVTIQRGCDKFCTFCVVPFTRGRERGIPPREILRLAREHAARGHKELTLLGQTVNSYRYEDVSFADLLRAVAQVEGIERIRFTSPYPVDFDTAVIDTIAGEAKVCKYVHLPVQSGSDQVLERMRRGYTVADFKRIAAELRAKIPDIALSTDILTGFCGETEEDHQQTLELMREIRFDSAFMFAYSERDLTYAAKKIPDDVPEEVKKRRLSEIIALQETISAEVFAAQVGKVEEVLIHSTSRRSDEQVVGRTDGFKSVILPRQCGGPGDLVRARITGSTMATLFGEPELG